MSFLTTALMVVCTPGFAAKGRKHPAPEARRTYFSMLTLISQCFPTTDCSAKKSHHVEVPPPTTSTLFASKLMYPSSLSP